MPDYESCDPTTSGCYDGLRPIDPDYVWNKDAEDPVAELKREQAAKALFPCPIHDPERFLLWRDGEWPKRSVVGRLRETVDGEVIIRTAAELAVDVTKQLTLDES